MLALLALILLRTGSSSDAGQVDDDGWEVPSAADVKCDPDNPPRTKTDAGVGEFLPVVPIIKLSASTEKEATLKAGASVKFGALNDRLHIEIAPELEFATQKGIVDLFAFDDAASSGNKKWLVGATVGAQFWPKYRDHECERRASEREVQKRAFEQCLKKCTANPVAAEAKPFCDLSSGGFGSISPEDYCESGRELLRAVKDGPAVAGSVPNWHFSLGGSVGQQVFDRREEIDGQLMALKSDRLVGSLGFSAAHLHQGYPSGVRTVELGIRYDSGWKPGPGTVKWCEPTAPVLLDSGKATQRSVSGEKCEEAVLGRPTFEGHLFATLRFGYMDLRRSEGDAGKTVSLWRIAAGPFVDARWKTDAEIKVGLQVPFYFSASSGAGFDSKGYLGALRATLSLCAIRATDATVSAGVFITVDVLGDRYILHRALDW